ncbi:hypothetical protein CJ030_MR4G002206 [Morella rubra]|uniref:RING-type E3 ubiquitin transferase n=1 Tax=Morella rubra TaxID=262757 RepID=A0A6A1VUV3_9ROSI|nr:hypothetical protein CJ030_MR4G002207 [Morella rubra]KAB1216554.1 hypothetical protein CJ030_MR4G002206 [Morella rubra]
MEPRHPRTLGTYGRRIYDYEPDRWGSVPLSTRRDHNNLLHWRVLQADQRDLLFFEELRKLSPRLSEETIRIQLRTKTFVSSAIIMNLEEEAASVDQEADSCVICQGEYKNQEQIGILDCMHEYRADCLKKWLLAKNVCPLCKSEAMKTRRN